MAGLRDGFVTNVRVVPEDKRRKIDGFTSPSEFLADMRLKYDTAYSFNEHNIIPGKEDATFVAGRQWDPRIEQKRKDLNKPVLTFNRLIAFVAQVLGSRLKNETEIRVLPDKGGTKPVAQIREGIIRNIFKNSNADFARDEAYKYAVVGGQGVFALSIDWTDDDVFEQEARIKHIADPYSAVFDPLGTDPTGGDAEYGFTTDDIPKAMFKKRYPWAAETSFQDIGRWNNNGYWMTEETIRVVSYWRMVTKGTKTLALFQDGTTHDVTDMEEYEYINLVATRSDGSLYTREVQNRFAQLYICSGNDILEGPYDYPISSIPIYRVSGWEMNDGEKIHRWGLIRNLKDPQRLHNYWRSTIAEQLVAAPRNKWLTTKSAIQGHEMKWRRAPSSDDPFLYYNDGETPPVHIPPPGMDSALIAEAGMATQDLKDISNIHEAALGMPSNEVSKVAIQQRQMVTDTGTFIYDDRARLADERCAKNCNELIPFLYDTQRLMMVMGADNKEQMIVINDPANPNSDVTIGKYGVSVTVGASSITKRQLSTEQMMTFVNAVPQSAMLVADLLAESQDWAMSDKFAQRFRAMMDPRLLSPDEITPQMLEMQQQNQQMQQMQLQFAQMKEQLDLVLMQAKASQAQATADQARAMAYKAIMDAQSRATDVNSKVDERQLKQLLDMLDQHNSNIEEDRNFDLSKFEAIAKAANERAKTSNVSNIPMENEQ